MAALDLSYIAAPMVNQSDLPFRTLSHKYGATLTYTQMLQPEKLINDKDYLEFHLRDLSRRPKEHQVVVQLCGNDPVVTVEGARKIQDHCDGVGGYCLLITCPDLQVTRFKSRLSSGSSPGRALWSLSSRSKGLAHR